MKASPFFVEKVGAVYLAMIITNFWLVGQIVYACVKSFLVGFNLETAVGSQKSAQALGAPGTGS